MPMASTQMPAPTAAQMRTRRGVSTSAFWRPAATITSASRKASGGSAGST